MADISKCGDDTCPSRKRCWRYLAPSSNWQSWMAFDRAGKENCESFWPADVANKTGKKVLFLDIDGVLNCEATKERITGRGGLIDGFVGIDQNLLKRFTDWLEGKGVEIVLSSSWRQHEGMMAELIDHGIRWIDVTPRLGLRGFEITKWLNSNPVDCYVILDDIDQFMPDHRDALILTDPKIGVTDNDLVRAETILGRALKLAEKTGEQHG